VQARGERWVHLLQPGEQRGVCELPGVGQDVARRARPQLEHEGVDVTFPLVRVGIVHVILLLNTRWDH
jgi:hypothetical protein